MSTFKHLSIAQEAIEFQNGAFFKELTAIYQPYVGTNYLKKADVEVMNKALAVCIERHTGINAIVSVDNWQTCILVPDLDSNNVLLGEYRGWAKSEDGLKIIKKSGEVIKGTVSLQKSTVTGTFTKIIPTIHVSKEHFEPQRLSAEEIAAVTLHEVGHFFTYLEFLGRTVAGNFVLMGLDKVLRHGADVKERHTAIEAAGRSMEFKGDVIECMKNASDDKTVITLFISEMTNGMRTENAHSFYDHNAWEMLSDQFASRHGAGRHLVTGLDKMYNQYGYQVSIDRVTYYFMEIYKVLMLVSGMFGVAALSLMLGAPGIMLGVFFMSITYGMITNSHARDGAPTYDKPLDRALRVRRQLVEYAKQPNLPKEMVLTIVSDVRAIDVTIRSYTDHETWFEAVDKFLFKSSRIRSESVKFQKELEKLAINDLFLSAAKLKHA